MTRVLIVDDNADNRAVLNDALADEGYVLIEACDGAQAIQIAKQEPPDLILMDIMMPLMDGVECCRRLKADEATEHIPIIMVTALNHDTDVVEGLDAGAVDFVSKPYSYPVVRARVRGAVRSKSAFDKLTDRNREILQLAFAMTHDLQTPLASLVGAVESLEGSLNLNQGDDGPRQWLDRIRRSIDKMTQMLDELMEYAKAEPDASPRELVNMADVAVAALDQVQSLCDEKSIRVTTSLNSALVQAEGGAMIRVITNLLSNAAKYIEGSNGGTIHVDVRRDEDMAHITVTDNGPGIPPSQLENVFLPFKRATTKQKGTGLGLAIVKKYVEAFDGRAWLESDGHAGTAAHIDLPLAKRQSMPNIAKAA